MTQYTEAARVESDVDLATLVEPATIVAIRAAHRAGTGEPVVTVVEAGRRPRTFRFGTDAARDRFLLRLCDACARAKAAA